MQRLLLAPLAAAAAFLSSCGGNEAAQEDQAPPDAAPFLAIAIDPQWQQQRLHQCLGRKEHYRAAGVWQDGEEAPVVSAQAWARLSQDEQTEIFDIAACIAAAGQVLESTVTVSLAGEGSSAQVRKVVSDREFGRSITP